jgi:tRNA G18 (ribose-2'-O)-methylase SpoU
MMEENRKWTTDELQRLQPAEFLEAKKMSVIIVLDNIRSLYNVGSVFRSADAFLVEAIYLCGITATPPHRDIQKTALGASETVHWKYFESTLLAYEALKAEGYQTYCIEQTQASVMLQDMQIGLSQKIALVFGNEVKGVDQQIIDISDGCIEIPQFGTKHSFNISVSAGIVLWEVYKKKYLL